MTQDGSGGRPGRPWGAIHAPSQERAELAQLLRELVDSAPRRPTLKDLEGPLKYGHSQIGEFLSGRLRPTWQVIEDLVGATVPKAQRPARLQEARDRWEAAGRAPAAKTPVVISPTPAEERQVQSVGQQLIDAWRTVAEVEQAKAKAEGCGSSAVSW